MPRHSGNELQNDGRTVPVFSMTQGRVAENAGTVFLHSGTTSMADIEILVPISKATKDPKTGGFWVEGVATDESIDWTNEITAASDVQKSLPLLQKHGLLNYDHGKYPIGNVKDAEQLPATTLKSMFPGKAFNGTGTWVKGWVHPVTEYAPEDLRMVHHLAEVGADLFFSIQGGVNKSKNQSVTTKSGRQVTLIHPEFVNQVAITTQPINPNAICRMAKSLSAMLQTDWENDDTPIKLLVPSVELAKGMEAGSGTDAAGFIGGRALQPESLHGMETTTFDCPKCAAKVQKGMRYCPSCGGVLHLGKSLADGLREFSKMVLRM